MLTLFTSEAVDRFVDLGRLRAAIRDAHLAHGRGEIAAPGRLDAGAPGREYHVKAGEALGFYAVKANSGFFDNPPDRPAIQGAILVFDSRFGTPVAVIHSGRLTALRTAAASCVAMQALRSEVHRVAILGSGTQARAHRRAVLDTFPEAEVGVIPRTDWSQRSSSAGIDARACVATSDVVITVTPARQPLLELDDVRNDALVVAVGADAPGKQELATDLMSAAAVVADVAVQALAVGESQHLADQYAGLRGSVVELGAILAGRSPVIAPNELTVYDSTGTGFQDAAAAAALVTNATNVPSEVVLEW